MNNLSRVTLCPQKLGRSLFQCPCRCQRELDLLLICELTSLGLADGVESRWASTTWLGEGRCAQSLFTHRLTVLPHGTARGWCFLRSLGQASSLQTARYKGLYSRRTEIVGWDLFPFYSSVSKILLCRLLSVPMYLSHRDVYIYLDAQTGVAPTHAPLRLLWLTWYTNFSCLGI